jgi:hypothetical protein
MNYAVVSKDASQAPLNTVVNVVVLEAGSDWAPPQGFIIVPLTGTAGIGWTWDGTQFIAPPKEQAADSGSPSA